MTTVHYEDNERLINEDGTCDTTLDPPTPTPNPTEEEKQLLKEGYEIQMYLNDVEDEMRKMGVKMKGFYGYSKTPFELLASFKCALDNAAQEHPNPGSVLSIHNTASQVVHAKHNAKRSQLVFEIANLKKEIARLDNLQLLLNKYHLL